MEALKLECQNDGVLNKVVSTWFYTSHLSSSGVELTNGPKYLIELDSLTVQRPEANDTGIYQCELHPSSGMPVPGDKRFNYTVLKIPQFSNSIETLNVTVGQNFTLNYTIIYTEGIGPTLAVNSVNVLTGDTSTITQCTSSNCSTPINERISPSASFFDGTVNVFVSFREAALDDGGMYSASATAGFTAPNYAVVFPYEATITVNVTTAVPVSTTEFISMPTITTGAVIVPTATSFPGMLTATPSSSMPPTDAPLIEPTWLIGVLSALGAVIVIVLLVIVIIILFLFKYWDYCPLTQNKQHQDGAEKLSHYTLEENPQDFAIELSTGLNSDKTGQV